MSDYRLAISKKVKNSRVLIDKFNEGLARLRKSGRYGEIIKSWYGRPIYKDAVPPDYLRQMYEANGVKR